VQIPALSGLGHGTKIWVRYRMYYPPGFDIASATAGSAATRKRIRFGLDLSSVGHGTQFDLQHPHTNGGTNYQYLVHSLPTRWHPYDLSGHTPGSKIGRWVTYEWYFEAMGTPTGTIRTFIDGAFQHETTDFQVFDSTSTVTDRFSGQVWFNSYWNGNPTDNPLIAYAGQEIYVDDCTVHVGPSLPPNVDSVRGYPIIGDWRGPEIRP
jgi:hypothetical protein